MLILIITQYFIIEFFCQKDYASKEFCTIIISIYIGIMFLYFVYTNIKNNERDKIHNTEIQYYKDLLIKNNICLRYEGKIETKISKNNLDKSITKECIDCKFNVKHYE